MKTMTLKRQQLSFTRKSEKLLILLNLKMVVIFQELLDRDQPA